MKINACRGSHHSGISVSAVWPSDGIEKRDVLTRSSLPAVFTDLFKAAFARLLVKKQKDGDFTGMRLSAPFPPSLCSTA